MEPSEVAQGVFFCFFLLEEVILKDVFLFWSDQFAVVDNDDNVALKLRGLPWQVTDEDVVTFFEGYKLVPDSVKIEKGDQKILSLNAQGACVASILKLYKVAWRSVSVSP